ncbi:DUF6894 family protein [Sphingomonas trueperi]|uniref:DUF6894 family protein n=1 Tax=Sphingomonas trueperi TaxID=53317 RepID=UPI000EB55680
MQYFFNSVDGGMETDKVGAEFESLEAARVHAIAVSLLQDSAQSVWHERDFRIEITNDRGLVPCTLIIINIDSAAVAQQRRSDAACRRTSQRRTLRLGSKLTQGQWPVSWPAQSMNLLRCSSEP